MLVVDASVVVVALLDDDEPGDVARSRLAGVELAAPELVDLEVGSVLRLLNLAGRLQAGRAEAAVEDLAALRIRRARHRLLLARCWELRANLTFYDAAYVALAETLSTTLLTADRRLTQAPGVRCLVEQIG